MEDVILFVLHLHLAAPSAPSPSLCLDCAVLVAQPLLLPLQLSVPLVLFSGGGVEEVAQGGGGGAGLPVPRLLRRLPLRLQRRQPHQRARVPRRQVRGRGRRAAHPAAFQVSSCQAERGHTAGTDFWSHVRVIVIMQFPRAGPPPFT